MWDADYCTDAWLCGKRYDESSSRNLQLCPIQPERFSLARQKYWSTKPPLTPSMHDARIEFKLKPQLDELLKQFSAIAPCLNQRKHSHTANASLIPGLPLVQNLQKTVTDCSLCVQCFLCWTSELTELSLWHWTIYFQASCYGINFNKISIFNCSVYTQVLCTSYLINHTTCFDWNQPSSGVFEPCCFPPMYQIKYS
jgi:hypothetical protein